MNEFEPTGIFEGHYTGVFTNDALAKLLKEPGEFYVELPNNFEAKISKSSLIECLGFDPNDETYDWVVDKDDRNEVPFYMLKEN